MHIAMLSYHTNPLAPLGGKHTGGMNVYVRELSRQLVASGHQVDMFTRATDGSSTQIEDLQEGLRLLAVPAGPGETLEKSQLSSHIPAFTQAVLDFASQEDEAYDLVHAHYWMSGLAGARLKAAWDAPLLLMFHTLGLVKNRIEALGPMESEARILGERRAAAAADRVIAATPAERAQLQWLYEVPGNKIAVIPPGVDTGLFQPIRKDEARARLGLPTEAQVILYAGRIEALKGIDVLVRAVNVLEAEDNLQVQVIGGESDLAEAEEGGEMARLRQLAGELGLSEKVRFLGSREQEELPLHYSAADVVVVPSYYESFGMVALEAMACGTPVIASRVGGLAFLVQDGETGFHVPEGDVNALAGRLKEILADQTLGEKMGAQAAQFATRFSWKQAAASVVEEYERLL